MKEKKFICRKCRKFFKELSNGGLCPDCRININNKNAQKLYLKYYGFKGYKHRNHRSKTGRENIKNKKLRMLWKIKKEKIRLKDLENNN